MALFSTAYVTGKAFTQFWGHLALREAHARK